VGFDHWWRTQKINGLVWGVIRPAGFSVHIFDVAKIFTKTLEAPPSKIELA
jgi:hypothetical protein